MNNRQTRTNEGGSVASFIVIGVILAAIVVGGIYVVQKRGENSPAVSPTATSSPSASPSVASSSDPSPPAVSPGTQATPTPSKSPSTQPSKTPLPSTGVPLPTTGPSDNILSVIAFAVLLGVSIAYLRSYRFRFGSLRR
jgi:LPXTG-motif cell wall-anchored protein